MYTDGMEQLPSGKMSLRTLENEILRKSYEEAVSINRAIVERLKHEGKVFVFMEAAVVADEKLLKHAHNEALIQNVVTIQ